MEIYTLDSLLRRTAVFDLYESLIWTERWREIGDIQLDLKSTQHNRNQFREGTHLAINESYRVMTVETVEDTIDDEGKEILKVKGRSLEAILEDRVVKQFLDDLVADPEWVLVAEPGNIARQMFHYICVLGALDPGDVIPFIQAGALLPPPNIPEPDSPIEWVQKPDALSKAIGDICQLYDLGYRLIRNFDTSQLYFDIYTGNDRTTRQSILTPVIFSPRLDNLQSTTEFSSVQGSKNVAYVFSEGGHAVVYGDNIDPDIEGFERRVLVVNANVPADHPDIEGALVQAGTEELRKNRAIALFDGELNQRGEYKYGRDYELGDLVEMRNRDGIVTYKRVTEQIFVSDAEGDRSYPTLAIDQFAGVNTWLSWHNKSTVWEDFVDEVWAEM